MKYYTYTDGKNSYCYLATDIVAADKLLKLDGHNFMKFSCRTDIVLKFIDTNLVKIGYIKTRKTLTGWSNYPQDIEPAPFIKSSGLVYSKRICCENELEEFLKSKPKFYTNVIIELNNKVKMVAFSLDDAKNKIRDIFCEKHKFLILNSKKI